MRNLAAAVLVVLSLQAPVAAAPPAAPAVRVTVLQDGSTFDFSRSGTLEAHINAQGYDHPLNATIAVEDKQMRITTRNPHNNQDETRTCLIRELTADSLIVEFEKNETFKMVRVK